MSIFDELHFQNLILGKRYNTILLVSTEGGHF